MDFIFEVLFDIIGELLFTGGEEALKSSKTPKPLRYIIAGVIILFFAAVIGLLIFAGIAVIMKHTVIGGIAILVVASVLFVLAVRKVIKMIKKIKAIEEMDEK